MSRPSPVNQLPVSLLLSCGGLSAAGMVMLGAGVIGMTQPALVPALAKPGIVWPLIAVGAMLDTAAVSLLLGALRTKSRAN